MAVAEIPAGAVEHRSGVRHAGIFFQSGPDRVYGAFYAPPARCRFAVVVCTGWGAETMAMLHWYHRLAHDLARSGIATLVPHWPGTQDSEGDVLTITLDRLVDTVADAQPVLADLAGTDRLGLVGTRVGAAVAASAAPIVGASRLVLTQPVFDIRANFDQEASSYRRMRMGAAVQPDWAWGFPLPPGLAQPDVEARIRSSLEAFSGRGAIVRYRTPEPAPAPPALRTIVVWGDWRRPARRDHGPLRLATVRWLARSLWRDR